MTVWINNKQVGLSDMIDGDEDDFRDGFDDRKAGRLPANTGNRQYMAGYAEAAREHQDAHNN